MANAWGTIYHNAVARGEDHGYAAYLADRWEQRRSHMIKPRGDVIRSTEPKAAYVPLGNPKIEIATWCPDVEAKLPPEQVHLILRLQELEEMPIVVRFYSPVSLGFLIEELTRYRREVWPDCEEVEGER